MWVKISAIKQRQFGWICDRLSIVALGNKTGGKNFELGISGNPNGRPKLSEDIKSLRNHGQLELSNTIAKLLSCSYEEFKLLEDCNTLTTHEKLIISILGKSIATGDSKGYETVLNRFLGRTGMLPPTQQGPISIVSLIKEAAESYKTSEEDS